MRINFQTFNSRFARRLFSFLFLAITLPVAVLASITLLQVSDQLTVQHRDQLHKDAKHIGMSLFERLQRVVGDMQLAALRPELTATAASATWFRPAFDSDGASLNPPWLELAAPEPWMLEAALGGLSSTQQSDGVWVRMLQSGGEPSAFMVVIRSGGETLVAQVREDYLWDAEQLAEDQLICIIDAESIPLFCNRSDGREALKALAAQGLGGASGYYTWRNAERGMRSVYWEVFLRGLGMNDNWTVVLSEPEQRFFAPSGRFGFSMVVIILVSMLAALMFSIRHIRRVLRPLDILRRATARVGEGHLDKPVVVDSDDEFEELADSFNGMMGKLALQFHQLEALADIDRLILSTMDPDLVVGQVAERIRQLLGSELLVVVAEQQHKQPLIIGVADSPVEVGIIDSERFSQAVDKLTQQGEMLVSERPAWLSCSPLGQKVASWTLIPIQVRDVKGMVVLGSRQSRDLAALHLPAALQSIRRISIALTRARWQAELYQQAHHDELTGLPNRSALKMKLSEALARATKDGTRVAVMFIDLDRFKLINDALGHAAGDEYLCQIAERIRQCARPADLVARLGGDEFTIAVADIPSDHDVPAMVEAVISRLLAVVPQPVRVGLHELRSTLSIGVAIFPDDGENLDDLMKQADTAMYQSKRRGGNSHHFFVNDMHVAAQQRMELESDMRHALETSGFELYYQPQVSAETGLMVGAEVLLRWQHPTRGNISPGIFIPIAEESMLIAEIDRWVLDAACRQIRSWLDEGLTPVPLSINISAAHFQQPAFVGRVRNSLTDYQLGPQRIELEITEGALINDLSFALQSLQGLHDEGVKLAIDDFGTGYCSLGYLKDMPIDKLKIDQSFIRNVDRSGRDAAIVEVILQLSRRLGLQCVAEGVETEEERLWLHANGCDAYQGYLFHRPMALADFRMLLIRDARDLELTN
ncbi:EAL domain-containing protein [Pseudomonas sp. gcc21]|uniref:putative bifunctional diguanylate cyclase/phosphodiesterase n=1 Tax=Pseudomonas sp. gcc21 TaxID=2726989 RepID=UPI001451921B|nr:EAL domain-containing protein [Pseudomonas sp. gcc21]QJD58562.1 EAL domain-containing protein [Pseudomonas sp. gcc21]